VTHVASAAPRAPARCRRRSLQSRHRLLGDVVTIEADLSG